MRFFATPLPLRYQGIIKSATNIFDQSFLWNPEKQNFFDSLDSFSPDILFCDVDNVNNAIISACNNFTNLKKIVLFSNRPINSLRSDLICAEPSISATMKRNLERNGSTLFYLSDYADISNLSNEKKEEQFKSDFSYYFSAEEKAQVEKSMAASAEKFSSLLAYLKSLSEIGKLKITGASKLPVPEHLGYLPPDRVISFLKSSKISLDICGGNLFNQAANGIFTVSTTDNYLFPTIKINKDAKDKIKELLENPETRDKITKEAQEKVFRNDTSYQRLSTILDKIGLNEFAQKSKNKIKEIKCELELL